MEWAETRKIELGLFLGGVMLIGAGIGISRLNKQNEPVEVLGTETQASGEAKLVADVTGAVKNPGVYEISADTRVGEVIDAAGGLSEQADIEWVAANINRAEKVNDGEKIYIPTKNTEVRNSNIETSSNIQISNKISINKASLGELDTLPGVGPVTAAKIISGRPFNSVQELLDRKIVGAKVYEQIKNSLSLW
jgi:competence protein ComEA